MTVDDHTSWLRLNGGSRDEVVFHVFRSVMVMKITLTVSEVMFRLAPNVHFVVRLWLEVFSLFQCQRCDEACKCIFLSVVGCTRGESVGLKHSQK